MSKTAMQELKEDLLLTKENSLIILDQIINNEKKEIAKWVLNQTIYRIIERIDSELLDLEKHQHNQTWDSAHQAGRFEGKGIAEDNWQIFEEYYNETFKSE